MDKIYRKLYGKHWALMHLLFMAIFNVLVVAVLKKFDVIANVFKLINYDIISLSGTIAGFEFASVSIFISLDGNKKLKTIKSINLEKIIYNIMISSILSLVIS
ncbi:MAG: hypothetical protein LUH07_00200, partial [Lachnospiraceae bacterium]|nr:hypothetical protein [Lachnospiraceae bacterium]